VSSSLDPKTPLPSPGVAELLPRIGRRIGITADRLRELEAGSRTNRSWRHVSSSASITSSALGANGSSRPLTMTTESPTTPTLSGAG